MNATASPPFTDVPERIAQVIWVLCQTVTERFSFRVRTLTREQVEYIVARLLAARTRFRRVVERVRAGRPPKARAPKKPRVRRVTPPKLEPLSDAELNQGFPPPRGWKRWAREDRAAARRAARERAALERAAAAARPVPVWRSLRQHLFGWLCGCAPAIYEFPGSAAAHADEMRRLLADPEMQTLLMSHRCVGDSLRKICWGLGVEPSLLYPAAAVPAAPGGAEPAFFAPTPATPTTGDQPCPGAAVDGVVPSSGASPPSCRNARFFETG